MKPTDWMCPWTAESAIDRVNSCLVLLYVKGFLSEAEKERVRKRIEKWRQKHVKETKR